ncbi:inorganic phosphate transporter [Gryllotalpicola protaetiae]|uniref:Phosphate transporter n=1 Tax=Gryllotalpicola protaetiae TaxID=2419771 RepID=A0A387BFT0_9MICO|nr:inorganic phosphate transporter [Gryllotalpicola protaetiae]AYG02783.1 anion permease [Gryllotalpicola protaetiae]
MDALAIVILVVVLGLVFDFTNGFHDTANAMATSVATGALKPRVAVLISAVLNLIGAFLSTEVAATVSGGIVKEGQGGIEITPVMIFAGLVGAIMWNLATWYVGLPSSSTHALFGGLIGAAIVGSGFNAVDWANVISKIALPALFAPIVAGLVAMVATYSAYMITRRATTRGSDRGFRYGQTVSASLVSLAHGTNDAQKTMGVITLTFVAAGYQHSGTSPQFWVILACALAIAAGTYSGGWRIMRTVGKRITEVTPPQGFAAEASSAATILVSSHLGFPLSTTQVTTGSIVGSGLGKRLASVRWGTFGRMVAAWLITVPAAALVAALASFIVGTGAIGTVVVVVAAVAGMAAFWFLSRRHPVTKETVNDDEDVLARKPATVSVGGAK